MSQEIMLKKKCVVSEELEKIGWGKYQKKLFIACFCVSFYIVIEFNYVVD